MWGLGLPKYKYVVLFEMVWYIQNNYTRLVYMVVDQRDNSSLLEL